MKCSSNFICHCVKHEFFFLYLKRPKLIWNSTQLTKIAICLTNFIYKNCEEEFQNKMVLGFISPNPKNYNFIFNDAK